MLINFTNIKKKYDMNIKGIIHIGAHYGEEIAEYVNNGIQNIILFEPLEENFNVLKGRVQNLNANIQGYQIALGSEKKTAIMNLSSNNLESSSLLKPKLHLEHHGHVKFEGTKEVEVDLLDNYDVGDCNFINMDVQGYELEVLRGAKEILNQIDYVYCEVNRGEVYENNAMIDEIDEYLGEYGFERVETHWPEEWFQWGDAVYIKRK
jgi:FkbM family methyltransferase